MLREVPWGNDSDFSKAAMINRINSNLANGIGNLAQRSLSMIAKNCGGAVPQHGDFAEADKALLEKARGLVEPFGARWTFRRFIKLLMRFGT